jgi:hypothetical protein
MATFESDYSRDLRMIIYAFITLLFNRLRSITLDYHRYASLRFVMITLDTQNSIGTKLPDEMKQSA